MEGSDCQLEILGDFPGTDSTAHCNARIIRVMSNYLTGHLAWGRAFPDLPDPPPSLQVPDALPYTPPTLNRARWLPRHFGMTCR